MYKRPLTQKYKRMKNYTLTDWFSAIKLGLWDQGYVDNVGYVKKYKNILYDIPQSPDFNYSELITCGISVSNQIILVKTDTLASYNNINKHEYLLSFAVRDVFTGNWSTTEYILRCYNKETWIQSVYPMARKSATKGNTHQMTKSKPYEIKNRATYSVRGRELPQPRRFKS